MTRKNVVFSKLVTNTGKHVVCKAHRTTQNNTINTTSLHLCSS